MQLFQNDRTAFENDNCIFYQNSMTDGADQWAKEWGLKGVCCFIAVQKTNKDDKDYVLIENDSIIFFHTQYEAIAAHIDIMAVQKGLSRQ